MRDILLPFGMGFCQFGQIEHIGAVSLWGLWVGIFCAVAVIALLNSAKRLNEMRIVDGEQVISLDDIFNSDWFLPAVLFVSFGALIGVAGYLVSLNMPLCLIGWKGILRWIYLFSLAVAIGGYIRWERAFLMKIQAQFSFEQKL